MAEKRSHILVVDDEEANRELLARRLFRKGFDVTCAEDGLQALTAIRDGAFDLVLLDHMMPNLSGAQVLQSLRKTHSSSDLPVIMVTAESDSTRIVEALELGANDYIVKPIDFAVALARMNTQLTRKHTEEALRDSEARFSLAANGTNDGIWDWNLKTNRIYYSSRWCSMLGLDPVDISANPSEWLSRIHPDDGPSTSEAIDAHLAGLTAFLEVEHKVQHKNGSYRWMLARGLATRLSDGTATRIAGSLTDITTSKASDPLTGLPNRLQFLDRLEQAIVETRNNPETHCAVIFMDLDRFKLVNDSLGHLVGDALLIGITRRLQSAVRSSDVLMRMSEAQRARRPQNEPGTCEISTAAGAPFCASSSEAQTVARFGGDEFAILLRGLNTPEDAVTVATRILSELSTPFQLGENEVYTSASLGIAITGTGYEADGSGQAAAMLRDADTAMYRAKAGGKNCFEVFDIAMRAETVARLRLETDLRRTIERGGFSLLYQPILSLKTNRIEGVEALIRWSDSDGKPVSPTIFIALAEETNLVVDIGKWVLGEACQQMAKWNTEAIGGRQLSLHVNVSCKEFLQRTFVERVSATLKSTGLSPHQLKLEITESGIMDNAELTSETLLELKSRSIGLSIDDFGTGYSSLSYLSRFPIDSLKIDRSFVSKLGGAPEDSLIVKAIIELAHALRLEVIAEGIETVQQLDLIRDLGCEFAQGYFISHPLTASEFEALCL